MRHFDCSPRRQYVSGVASRADYEPWDRPPVVIDTTGRAVDQSVAEAVGALQIY